MLADLAVLERDEAALTTNMRHWPQRTAERDGHMSIQASAQRALGVLHRLTGDYVEAEDHLLQALQIFEELETRWQLGRTLVELQSWLQPGKYPTETRDYCARAPGSLYRNGGCTGYGAHAGGAGLIGP